LNPDKKDYGPFYKVFGFRSPEDTIVCISDILLTDEERDNYFEHKWWFSMMYGGIWYAPNGTEKPPIKNMTKYFEPNWAELKVAGQKHSKELGLVPDGDSPWFKED
jgi:hypothetical protein